MSPSVDNRIVNLDFNNEEFEKGTRESVESLNELKEGLDLTESAKNLNQLQTAGKKFSLANIGQGVQTIASRFSALGIIGITVLQNLTNAAIQAGKRIVSSLMMPLRMGYSEYETQINAIQTILANTEKEGTNLQTVTAALDELNTYADQTIYNFTEMTRNIGTFTAAGVSLDTSVAAIKGIANLAAVSGSTSQQAATAMYQLSQALSSGTVKLMDWNSVVNAGMGGQVFQDALKETARVSGIAIDDLIDKHGSFRETLQTGWLSSDVLLQTLQKFTGDLTEEQLVAIGYTEEQIASILKLGQTANDAATKVKTFTQLKDTLQEALQSGWTKSWEIIIGDFDEAKLFFTEVSDTLGALIESGAAARNAFLQEWSDAGGRAHLISTLRYAFEALLSVIAPIKEAFKNIFPEEFTGTDLARITIQIREFAKTLTLSSENADRVKRIFQGVFSVFSVLRDVVVNLAQVFLGLAGDVPLTTDGVLEFLAGIGDYLTGLKDSIDVSEGFRIALSKMSEVFEQLKTGVTQFVEIVRTKFQEVVDWFDGLFDSVDPSGITEFFDKIELRFEPLTLLAKGAGVLIDGLFKFFKKVGPALFYIGSLIWEFISNLGSAILDGLQSVDYVGLFDTLNTGLIGALLLAVSNFMTKGAQAFDGIAEILDGVGGSLEAWQVNLKAKTLFTIAAAIGLLAISLIALALIPSEKLTVALGAITGLVVNLVGAMAALGSIGVSGLGTTVALVGMSLAVLTLAHALSTLSKVDAGAMDRSIGAILALTTALITFSHLMSQNGSSLLTGALGLIAFSASLGILVLVVKALGSLDPETITNGLIGVGVMLAEIAAFMAIVDGSKVGPGSGLAILAMAGAMLVLTMAVEKFGEMDVNVLEQGLLAIAGVLATLAAFSNLTGEGDLLATSVGVAILAGSMLILVQALEQMGAMAPEEIGRGLAAMGGSLIILAAAINLMPPNVLITAVGIAILAGSLVILGMALDSMGSMSWEEIGKGLAVMAASLTILTVALYAMTGTIAGSAALLVAAAALLMLAPALETLGGIPINEIGIALLALVGVFTILGVAGLLLTPVVPTILALGAAMLLIGAGAALVGAGLLAFSAGLATLAVSGAAGAVAIVAIITTLLGLLPVIVQVLIDTIIVFATGITAAVPIVGEAIKSLLLKVLEIIIEGIPPLAEAIKVLLLALIDVFIATIPEFNAAIVLIILELLVAIAEAIPSIVQAGFDILVGLLSGIRDNIGDVVTTVGEIIVEFLGALEETIPDIVQAGFDLLVALIQGFSDAINDQQNQASLSAATTELIQGIIDGLIAGLGTLGNQFIEAMKQLALDAIQGMLDVFKSESPSKVMIDIGKTLPQGLAIGVTKLGKNVTSAVGRLGRSAISKMSDTMGTLKENLDTDFDMAPTVSPVLDMSSIETGGRILDNIFGRERTLNLVPAINSSANAAVRLNGQVGADGNVISSGDSNVSFVQNNYSPKALSRLEIYRQTKNQLLALKGAGKS